MTTAIYRVTFRSGATLKVLIASNNPVQLSEVLSELTPDGDPIASVSKADPVHPGESIILREDLPPVGGDDASRDARNARLQAFARRFAPATEIVPIPSTETTADRLLREYADHVADVMRAVAASLTAYGWPTTYEYPGFLEIIAGAGRFRVGSSVVNGPWTVEQYAADREAHETGPLAEIETGIDDRDDQGDIRAALIAAVRELQNRHLYRDALSRRS